MFKSSDSGLEVMMIRSFQSVVVFLTIVVSAPIAEAFQTQKGPPASFSSSTLERSGSPGAGLPSRRTQTRTEANGREVITETTEMPGPDGKMRMSQETTRETVRTGPDSTQIKQDVFANDGQGRRRLVETTQTDIQTLGAGASRSVANTYAPDLNGRLGISAREIQEVKSPAPNVKQTDTTIYRPGVNEPLLESERLQKTERQVSKELTQSESTRLVRDGNGRWQTAETRQEEVKVSGSERVSEETVRKASVNGALAVSERKVTRQSKTNSGDETVTEIYLRNVEGLAGAGDRLELSQRVRNTTSVAPDGGQQTIREVEGRSAMSPNGPLRVIERTIDTLRQVGPDRWEVERQVFALDGNGRLVPVVTEKGLSVK